MIFFLKPLFNENYNKHSGHNKIKAFGVKRNERTQNSAKGRAGNPINLVKKRNRKIKFALFNSFRNGGGTVYGKSFVRKRKDKIKFFKENDVKISISVDGNDESSNACRILCNKTNSIMVIKRAIDLLNKNNVKINALAVLNKRNYQYVDKIIDFFVENNIYDFSFNYFIKGGRGNKNSHLSLTNEEVFEATKMVVDKIEEYFKKGIILNEKNVYYLYKMVKTGRKHYMC